MGILNRFTTIIKANVNEMLDRAEDPAKMVDQYLIDLSDSLAEVKQETAAVMAEEKRQERLVADCQKEVDRMEGLARKALAAGNEGDARTFLAKKQELETQLAELKRAAATAHENSEKMRQMHDKLVDDIEELKARRESIKAKSAVARTQTMVNNFTSGADRAQGTIDAFNRMEAKADRELDMANATAELNAKPVDEVEALEQKYGAAASDAAIDDEIARLKEEMGL